MEIDVQKVQAAAETIVFAGCLVALFMAGLLALAIKVFPDAFTSGEKE